MTQYVRQSAGFTLFNVIRDTGFCMKHRKRRTEPKRKKARPAPEQKEEHRAPDPLLKEVAEANKGIVDPAERERVIPSKPC